MNTQRNNKGQAMVEYIIIVVLIAVTLIVLFGGFGKAIAQKISGATSSISDDVGSETQDEYGKITTDGKKLKSMKDDGTFD